MNVSIDLMEQIRELQEKNITPSLIKLGKFSFSQLKHEVLTLVPCEDKNPNHFYGIKIEVTGDYYFVSVT